MKPTHSRFTRRSLGSECTPGLVLLTALSLASGACWHPVPTPGPDGGAPGDVSNGEHNDRFAPVDTPPTPLEDGSANAAQDAPRDQGTDAYDVLPEGDVVAPIPVSEQRSCVTPQTPGCGLVEIAASGPFTLGAAARCEDDPSVAGCAYRAAPPQTNLRVSAFAMDAYEVTVARFRAFSVARSRLRDLIATIHATPIRYPDGTEIFWLGTGSEPRSTSEDARCNWTVQESSPSRESHPINCVDWWAAQEFCVWDGGRLPTEAEWEYAARWRPVPGLNSDRLYPWGDEPPRLTCNRARWNSSGCFGEDGAQTRRVGSFPMGASGGLFDLAGNVAEWVADRDAIYDQTVAPCPRSNLSNPICEGLTTRETNRVLRGGYWDIPADQVGRLRVASRDSLTGAGSPPGAGFRCVRTRAR